MKNLAAVLFTLATATIASAQPGPDQPAPADDCCTDAEGKALAQPSRPVAAAPQLAPSPTLEDDGGWQRPPGQRFLHGFRIGYMFLMNGDAKNRTAEMEGGEMVTLKDKYGLKTPHMMLLGYEGFYRIIGHSWLNVLLVGNVTVAGLEQSKFIPAASGLIGFELDHSFQFGVGVNVTPDEDAPTHAIFAAGWTPKIGAIHTPVHFFFVPEPGVNGEKGNHRIGGTVGVTW